MKKGFTLIELLVVIAIIGILSGTVIVSMSGAQNSAKDARIKSGMDQLRSYAEVYRLLHSSTGYGDDITNFTNDGSALTVIDGELIKADIEDDSNGGHLTVKATATAYCMSTPLNGSAGTICMDSAGKVGTAACVSATACP